MLSRELPVWLLCGLSIFFLAQTANAEIFFSVEVNDDQLVAIDSDTGRVTVVGPIGVPISSVDLTTVGNRLFALDTFFENSVDLHELNPATGASISSVPVEIGAMPILHAEGLAYVGTQLKIGFRDLTTFQFSTLSNRLGDLSETGQITNIQVPSGNLTDFDGLGVDPVSGQLYQPDVNPFGGPNDTIFYTVDESPITLGLLHTDSNSLGVNDVIVLDGVLWGIDNVNTTLISLNLDTNFLTIIPLDLPGTYTGITTGFLPPAVPIPLSGALLLLGTLGGVAARALRPRLEDHTRVA